MAVFKILAALFVSMALYEVSTAANVYHVGDSIGWTIGKVNYTLWAETKAFVLGDTIIFEYNKQYHNVVQVTHEDFNSCNTTAPVATFDTGNDSFNISRYGHYYYVCGVPGHCQAGQKVDIRVPRPRGSPSPSPDPSPRPWPRPTPGPKPQPGSPSPSPYTAAPPSWGSEPAPAPTPGMPAPPSSWGSEPAPAPGMAPGPWWMAPAPAPSPASSLYASVGMLYSSIAVLASVVTAFAY